MNTMQITANDITTYLLIKEYQKQRVVTFKDSVAEILMEAK